MLRLTITALLFTTLVFTSCSTCYECTQEVELTDGNGNPIDTTTNTEEFCTGDPDEVTAREDEGASCRVQ